MANLATIGGILRGTTETSNGSAFDNLGKLGQVGLALSSPQNFIALRQAASEQEAEQQQARLEQLQSTRSELFNILSDPEKSARLTPQSRQSIKETLSTIDQQLNTAGVSVPAVPEFAPDPTAMTGGRATQINASLDKVVQRLPENVRPFLSADLFADPTKRRQEVLKVREALQKPENQDRQVRQMVMPDGDTRTILDDGEGGFYDLNGRKLTVPEGARIINSAQLQGSQEDLGLAPTKKTRDTLQDKIVGIQDNIQSLEDTLNTFDPSFLETLPRAGAALANFADKLGVQLSGEQKEFLEEFSVFGQNAIANVNRTIKQITGAQMSEREADRIRKQVPDPENDGPTKFEAKLRNSIKQLKMANARYTWMLRNNLITEGEEITNDNPAPVSIDRFEAIIDRRGDEIKQANPNMSDEEILSQLREEFGF